MHSTYGQLPRAALGAVLAIGAAGCAALGLGYQAGPLAPTSVQRLEYYPFQVKGYQNSYPSRTITVLAPIDARKLPAGTKAYGNGTNPPIGFIAGQQGEILQRLYSRPLAPIIQKAIAGSAREAGLRPRISPESDYSKAQHTGSDYVLAARITRCWVEKRRGADTRLGQVWTSAAEFRLEVTIYKPPFSVPFWEGKTRATYHDPPVGSFGLGPEDEAGIYDQPGEVLSVALTRAVAGIFQRRDLRALIEQDRVAAR